MIPEGTWWIHSREKWDAVKKQFEEETILDRHLVHQECGFCAHFSIENPDEELIEEYGNDCASCAECPAFKENICANIATLNRGRTMKILLDMCQQLPLTNEIEIKRTRRLIGEVSDFINRHKPDSIRGGEI